MAECESRGYRLLKWLWLLIHCAMPTMAVLYGLDYVDGLEAAEEQVLGLSPGIFGLLFSLSGGLFMVLWIISEALLSMYRFPLKSMAALLLVSGYVTQLVMLALTGDSIRFAAYVSVYVTLAAVLVCFALMAFATMVKLGVNFLDKYGLRSFLAAWGLAVGGLLVCLFALAALFPPLWAGYRDLRPLYQVVNAGVLLLNTGTTVRILIGLSVWGKPDPDRAQYDAEWKTWAAPTVIHLILAATAAIMAGGILRVA